MANSGVADDSSSRADGVRGDDGVSIRHLPFEESLRFAIRRIRDQSFLFVIVLAILLIGLVALGGIVGYSDLRFTITVAVIAALGFVALLGFLQMSHAKSGQQSGSRTVRGTIERTTEPRRPLGDGDESTNPYAELAPVFQLRVIRGPQTGQSFILSRARVIVGRRAGNDIVLLDRAASRFHFGLNWDLAKRTFNLVDGGSANGVLVNGTYVQGHQELTPNDVVEVGDTDMIFERIKPATA